MRLELEPNPSQIVYPETAATEMSAEERAGEASSHLREGIRSAQTGNRSSARASLLRAAELDPRNESAWLWLSSISEYPEELLVFLTNVLEINPLNARALEWSVATRGLLAKNFVQRGVDAVESGQKDIALQHFNQALEYDERNSMAWLWLSSLADSSEGKLSYLEKVLEFDPENEAARAALEASRNAIRTGLLGEARAAAVAGKADEADALLNAIIAEEPDAEDAWVLRSHLANDFSSKVAAFRRILEINPENAAAKSGLDSLTQIMEAVTDTEKISQAPVPTEKPQVNEVQAETPVSFDAPAASWPHTQFENEGVENEDQDIMVSASPFDNFADEDFSVNKGTMQVETAETSQACDELPDPGPTSAENLFEGEFTPPKAPGWWAGSSNDARSAENRSFNEPTDELVRADDLEPIVYEFTKEANEEIYEAVPQEENEPIAAEFVIPEPSLNPFHKSPVADEADHFKTVVSVELDEEMRAAVENYDPLVQAVVEEPSTRGDAFNVPFDMTMYGGQYIPMPTGDLNEAEASFTPSFEVRRAEPKPASVANKCSYCGHENDIQVITCHGCLAVLTLADLELILANNHADKNTLRKAVDEMERERATREFSEAELTTLGIGHLNLRNLQYGYQYLHEASLKNPDNVVLSGQTNALLIRLEEIKEQDAVHDAMTKGKTILVVDDSPTVRKLISGKLEKCGHEVICSGDGVEAMEALATIKPDLILLDITMPRMDGYQVCKEIRANEVLKDVPVVMISGKDGFFDKVRGRMAGTSGYITKPFGPETLMKAVESYLRPEA